MLLVVGSVLAIVGFTDIGLLYLPPAFGNNEWEFGIIAQTFDAMPIATMAMLLLALGLKGRGAPRALARAFAIACGVIALVMVLLLVIFTLDIPIALAAMNRSTPNAQGVPTPPNPVVIAGIRRGIAKAVLFGLLYAGAFVALARQMWREKSEPTQ